MSKRRSLKRGRKYIVLLTAVLTALFLFMGDRIVRYTSTNEFCYSCHAHPHAEESLKKEVHYDNGAGIYVQCTECHLPPPGNLKYLLAKAKHGSYSVYHQIFTDIETVNWEAKSTLENAVKYTYDESCIKCHQNLFPMQLDAEGQQAHLYYSQNEDELSCLNCHLHVGHYSDLVQEGIQFGEEEVVKEIYTEPADVDAFEDFTETVPGTAVEFDMVAVTGGTFSMGSPPDESYREEDEGPVRNVEISPFFMGRTEVSWDEFLAFYNQTAAEGRQDNIYATNMGEVDAITGPTPPWGLPGQGWGMGARPAITMTWHAADTYCKWLSAITGKTYRLPTEAEWEYAARAGTTGPYFFEGDPKKFSREERLWNRIFGPDTTVINTYVIYSENSEARTQLPGSVQPNPFRLEHMLGNVYEFTGDWYAPDTYSTYSNGVVDPTGPDSGSERVIRGGSFNSDASEVRVAARSHTRHAQWQMTDPQIPKSLWWYTDTREVGFRVICEWEPDN